MNRRFLVVHGLGGSGPDHWQTWLVDRLRARGLEVVYPVLPDPGNPALGAWKAALDDLLDRLGADGTIVVCHSLGSVLWLHVAHEQPRRLAERVLLVAPPSAGSGVAEIAEFVPAPLDAEAVSRAASSRLVCSPSGDPYCPEGARVVYGEPLGLPVDEIPGGAHLNTDAGYGPWPGVERWCLDGSATPITAGN